MIKKTGRIPPTSTPTGTDQGYQTRTFRDRPDDHTDQLVLRRGSGPINVEVFSDYAHEGSQRFWNKTRYRLSDYYTRDLDTGDGPDISIVLRHFPKPVNEWSMFLPCAAMEVMVQKDLIAQAKFHDRLFENHFPDYSSRDVEIAASMVDADPDSGSSW